VEQIVFVEPGASRHVSWRAKVVSEGALRFFVDPHVVSEGRPMSGGLPRIPEPAALALGKPWTGTWTSPAGFVYDAEFQVRLDPSGAVEGSLRWILRKAPEGRTDYEGKIGAKGIEYVWGTSDPSGRNILGLDRYRLTLSESFDEIKGATWNHGTWKAAFRLTPK
jgi:hypothetical protein